MTGLHPVHVNFAGHGQLELAGILHPAHGPEQGAVILAHCFTCSKEFKIVAWLARELSARGYRCLRFDFAGLGESRGDFADTTLETDVDDLVAAARWLNADHPVPLSLVGHSMGGGAAILAARRLPEVKVVVTLATSAQVGGRIRQLIEPSGWDELERTGLTRVSVGGAEFPISVRFLRELDRISLPVELAGWGGAFLACYGTRDTVIPPEEAEALFAAAAAPKAWVALPGSGHLFAEHRKQALLLASIIDAWIQLNGGTRK